MGRGRPPPAGPLEPIESGPQGDSYGDDLDSLKPGRLARHEQQRLNAEGPYQNQQGLEGTVSDRGQCNDPLQVDRNAREDEAREGRRSPDFRREERIPSPAGPVESLGSMGSFDPEPIGVDEGRRGCGEGSRAEGGGRRAGRNPRCDPPGPPPERAIEGGPALVLRVSPSVPMDLPT